MDAKMTNETTTEAEILGRLAARGVDRLPDEVKDKAAAMLAEGGDAGVLAERVFRLATWPMALKHSRAAMMPACPSTADESILEAVHCLHGAGPEFARALVDMACRTPGAGGLGRAELGAEFEMRAIEWPIVQRMVLERFPAMDEVKLLELRLLHFAGAQSRDEILRLLQAIP